MLTQCHVDVINGFMGQTTDFRKEFIKSNVLILGENKAAGTAKYLHGEMGQGTWTFYGGHDPEDYQHFVGDDAEAIAYMMRTNKRRNLNSGQWATIAVEADELVSAIRAKVSENRGGRPKRDQLVDAVAIAVKDGKVRPLSAGAFIEDFDRNGGGKPGKKISQVSEEQKTAHKTAELFNTNRTYVNQAAKLRVEAPSVFEQVKAGTMRMTDAAKAVKAIPKDDWRPDERERQSLCNGGRSVVANASKDQNLIKWAEGEGKAVRVDRGSKYGNPFVLDADGDRDQVCNCYEKHYLPNKPSITGDIRKLSGMVLICHCYPLRCHGDSLAAKANEAAK
jgi:hypothetical protein